MQARRSTDAGPRHLGRLSSLEPGMSGGRWVPVLPQETPPGGRDGHVVDARLAAAQGALGIEIPLLVAECVEPPDRVVAPIIGGARR
jgi:hypothetical protein